MSTTKAKITVLAFMMGVPVPRKNKLICAMMLFEAKVNGWVLGKGE